MQDEIFVLDIGTRSVMALLGKYENEKLSVSHLVYKEHKTRAMLDGQIHNVEQVALLIEELVAEMKKSAGKELNKVAVAAAGRSLKTVIGKAVAKYAVSRMITEEDYLSLKLQAVQDAELKLPRNLSKETPLSQHYYCVGYSVLEEKLDSLRLGSIVRQKGQEAEIEVVATFLPRIVVDSLQNSVKRAGLEMTSITLEPIAVANLILSPSMRRLNLVLVDIGAGTSDIAVCGGDSVSAYGMVSLAGDEVTEAISDLYLLDFARAEEVKRKLDSADNLIVCDVLGVEEILNTAEVKAQLEPTVGSIVQEIAREIYNLNGKSPQAVLLVGGGSLTPGLPKMLAQALEIPENRVVVQLAGKLQNVLNLPAEYSGPDFITVLGIAYTAFTGTNMGFINVTINEEPVQLLNLSRINIAEALLAAGYSLQEIYGRPGLALSCELDGKLYTIPGTFGKPGKISLNGQPALYSEIVKNGDCLVFEPGTAGQNGSGKFSDLLKDYSAFCTVNGKKYMIQPSIIIDGKTLASDENIPDGCKAEIHASIRIDRLLKQMDIIDEEKSVWVNDRKVLFAEFAELTKNGQKASMTEFAGPGDEIKYVLPHTFRVRDFIPPNAGHFVEVFVNGRKTVLSCYDVCVNGVGADVSAPVKPGDKIEYKMSGKKYQPILVDIFNKFRFTPKPPPGRSQLVMQINGENAEYTHPLKNGDKITLSWQ